ncbi:unnamed protein product [Allacma fusca]|uniref:Cystathionine beta-synthase n=1 Tax=Allacma fusca TaxID=39272 RepID=A0A8J2L1N2_9HEXA|nr:unnamed protein product [Allacma fusca]
MMDAGRPKILDNVCQFVGQTPMIRLNRIPQSMGIECEVLAKCELFSAGGSHKDRIAIRMIEDAEKAGLLKEGSTIIEPTSGNTGIGVAMVAAVKGYKCILVMPEKMSAEKMDTMHALGATIIRTPNVPFGSAESHICVAERLHKETPNSYILDQYDNPANPKVHYDETAEEVLDQCDGRLDMIVIGAGTGGVITGIGRKMKEKLPGCLVVGVDPEGSIMAEPPSINENPGKFWEIEGIGHDFVPGVLDRTVVDKWVKIKDVDSLQMARRVISEEGILVGGSSGSAVMGAMKAIKEVGLGAGKRVVIIIPDSIRNYMTKFLSDQWMLERDFFPTTELQKQYSTWWDLPISILDNSKKLSVTVSPDNTVGEALALMSQNSISQVPCVDTDGILSGVITQEHLSKKLLSRELSKSALVSKATTSQFRRILPDANLGKLSCILGGHQFAVVVKPRVDNPKKEIPVGILTQADLMGYLNTVDF